MKPKTKNLNQSSLAKALGVSRQLIASHMKSADAPPINKPEAWAVYLAQKGRSGTAPPDLRRKIAEARLAILKEQQKGLMHKNRVEAGETMLTAEAIRQASEACGYFFSELERMERELPPSLAGGTAVDIFKRLHAAHEALRKSAKEKFEGVGK